MHLLSVMHRFISRIVAGALFAALFAVGIAPALAAPNLTLSKTPKGGTVAPGGTATFTIVLTNPSGSENAEGTEMVDQLPGTGIVDWEISDPGFFGCDIEGDFPAVETLRCDVGTVFPLDVLTVEVSGVTPNTGCLVLSNTATVTYDGHAPLVDSGRITTTCGADGRMTGGGSIFTGANGSVRITHGFEIRCDPTDARQNLEINWPGVNNQNNFHLTSMISAMCIDDPSIAPNPPKAGFDTYIGEGVGTCNGQPAAIEFVFTDAGEPGTKDTAEYHISGACSLDTAQSNLIKGGNQQAHKN